MKRFDQESVQNRLLQRLQVSENWSQIISQGTVGNLLATIAEGEAEIARYLEYLYNEKKWTNARNLSSTTHLTDLISYKRQLPKSAIGFIIVSHTDLNGNNRLNNFGSYFFNLDQTSDWDNLTQNLNASITEKSSLVPWTSDQSYIIPKGTIFKSANGVQFISTETMESRPLKEPYVAIRSDPTKYADFIKAGAWNGIKYVKIPVIQGEKITQNFGRATGERFESFIISNLAVENASNVISNEFFKIKVTPTIFNSGIESEADANTETWEQIIDIRLAGPYDKVFEKKILNDENRVLIKFGDGITGQRLPERSRIVCEYLLSMGNSGNIENKFQVTEMILPPGFNQIDTRFNTMSSFLSCTNIVPIMGGKNIENIGEIKVNAPPSYLETYAIATKATYLAQIIKNSPVNLLHCRIFQSGTIENRSYGTVENNEDYFVSDVKQGVLEEISINKNSLLITGIRANGTKIEDPELELIDPLIKAFDDNSSPNDNFDYIEPNFIEIRPNIIVSTSDTITEKQIQDSIMPEIMGKYSIFSTDFEKPYYKSDIVDIVQNYSFSKYSSIFLEAKATVDYVPGILVTQGNEPRNNLWPGDENVYLDEDQFKTLLTYKFNFDKLFSSNQLTAGFKNFKQNNSCLLRADIKFRSDPTRNKTLLLYDNRIDLYNTPDLISAENLPIDASKSIPVTKPHQYQFTDLNQYDYISEDFINQQVRTAQFNYIDRIISPSYFYQMKQWNQDPSELNFFYLDDTGKPKIFLESEIPSAFHKDIYNLSKQKIPLSAERMPTRRVYQKNTQYMPNCKLIFYENYNNTKDPLHATGYLIIPLNKVLLPSEAQYFYNDMDGVNDYGTMARYLEVTLRDQFTIDIYAQPILDDFNCINPYDIIFSRNTDTLIQRNFLKSV